MKSKKISQKELAARLGTTQPSLARLLSDGSGRTPNLLQRVLADLGLELTTRPVTRRVHPTFTEADKTPDDDAGFIRVAITLSEPNWCSVPRCGGADVF